MKKRILVLLSVVALMVVMLAMSVAPAFAAPPTFVCEVGSRVFSVPATDIGIFIRGGADCYKA
jgi:hypothetical protein